jgi:hypothetical protein
MDGNVTFQCATHLHSWNANVVTIPALSATDGLVPTTADFVYDNNSETF